MLDLEFNPDQISQSLGIDRSTVYRHHQRYLKEGLDAYLDLCVGGSMSYLSESEQAELKEYLSSHFYGSSRSICAYVLSTYGVRYSENGMISLLHRLDFVYKKTRQIPSHPPVEVQQEFVEQLVQKAENLQQDEGLYFMDGVHPQYNTRPECGWIPKGADFTIASNSGRKRLNIHGLLNPFEPTDVVAMDADRINGQSTIELLERLLIQHPDKSNIFVVCDNARYYHSKVLKDWLADKPIELVFLPPYCPNLNLIERLWKFMRKKIINSFYYYTYEQFREAILDFFREIKTYKSDLKSLISWKFQIIG